MFPGYLYGGHHRFLVQKNNPRVTNRRSHTGVTTECTLLKTRIYTLGYPGTKPSCFGHTQVYTRVPPENVPYEAQEYIVLGIRVPNWLLSPYSTIYPRILWGIRVPNLVAIAILEHISGYL